MEFLLGGLNIEDQAKTFGEKVLDLTLFLTEVLDIEVPNPKWPGKSSNLA